MAAKIVIADPIYGARLNDIRARVAAEANWLAVDRSDRARLTHEIGDADVVVTARFDAELARAAGRLRLLQSSASGIDGIDRSALGPGIVLCNTYHHEQSIAEHVLMMILALSRDLPGADRALRQGRWRSGIYDPAFPLHRLLSTGTVGLYGYGHIGQAVARAAKAFGMRVIALRRDPGQPSPDADEVRPVTEIEWLMRKADFAVTSAPLNDETRGAIGTDALAALGPQGYLINVGRAEIVDEEAVYNALINKTIAGAAIDVWYRYPEGASQLCQPSRYDFAALENVIMTPHHSGQARENFERRMDDFAHNIDVLLANRDDFRNRLDTP